MHRVYLIVLEGTVICSLLNSMVNQITYQGGARITNVPDCGICSLSGYHLATKLTFHILSVFKVVQLLVPGFVFVEYIIC